MGALRRKFERSNPFLNAIFVAFAAIRSDQGIPLVYAARAIFGRALADPFAEQAAEVVGVLQSGVRCDFFNRRFGFAQ